MSACTPSASTSSAPPRISSSTSCRPDPAPEPGPDRRPRQRRTPPGHHPPPGRSGADAASRAADGARARGRGVVDRVGADVDDHWIGSRVVAHLGLVPAGTPSRRSPPSRSCSRPGPRRLRGRDRCRRHWSHRPRRPRARAAESRRRRAGAIRRRRPRLAAGPGSRVVRRKVVAAAGGAERTDRLTELKPDLVVDYGDDGWADQVRRRPVASTWSTTASVATSAVRPWSCCARSAGW